MEKIKYTFSEELYAEKYGKPKGKNVWYFGDRREEIALIRVGNEEEPVSYSKAKKMAEERLTNIAFPIYKTVYLLPIDSLR